MGGWGTQGAIIYFHFTLVLVCVSLNRSGPAVQVAAMTGPGESSTGRRGLRSRVCLSLGVSFTSRPPLLFVVCLTSQQMLVYLRDGSAQTIVRAATLTSKLQIKLSTSPKSQYTEISPSADPTTPAPGKVATGVPILKSLV